MKIDLNTFYIVYKPDNAHTDSKDIVSRVKENIWDIYSIVTDEVTFNLIYGVFTSKSLAVSIAEKLWDDYLKENKTLQNSDKNKSVTFVKFISELEKLSFKYGFAIEKIMKVLVFEEPTKVSYSLDNKGNLLAKWNKNVSNTITEIVSDIKKMYIVFLPRGKTKRVDIFSNLSYTPDDLFIMFVGGLTPEFVQGLYTTKAEAQKEARKIYKKYNIKA